MCIKSIIIIHGVNCMSKIFRIGVAGLGDRGRGMAALIASFDDVELVACSEPLDFKIKIFKDLLMKEHGFSEDSFPKFYSSAHEMLEAEKLDGILIHSSWHTHTEIAIDAMQHGVYPAIDCGGASSLDECWNLVRCAEETKMRCMFLENCCYDRNEMTLLRMIKQGMFGELIHVQGGYEHDLRSEIAFGRENGHYRFTNYLHRNAELYPQHAIGPIMKYLNINHGNRFLSLTSTASKSRGLHEFLMENKGDSYDASHFDFKQGDIVTTVIKCAGGETVLLTHDTTLPRPYSRAGRVQGTKAIWMEDKDAISFGEKWEDFSSYSTDERYEHPIWRDMRLHPEKMECGHGGMDFLVLDAYMTSLRRDQLPPIDVYDAAVLLSISVLSEMSIAQGSAPISIPDFTNGKWMWPRENPDSPYALDDFYPERY